MADSKYDLSTLKLSKYKSLYLKYKKHVITKFGKKALDDRQLTELGRNIFGSKYLGTFPQDKVPWNKTGYLICNVDTSKKINTDDAHWVAIYTTKTRLYIYDTFGRHTSFILPIVFEKAAKINKKIIEADHDPEQYGYSEICGQLSMAFLCVVKDLGVKKALTI